MSYNWGYYNWGSGGDGGGDNPWWVIAVAVGLIAVVGGYLWLADSLKWWPYG